MHFICMNNPIDVILVCYLTSTPAAGHGLICAFFSSIVVLLMLNEYANAISAVYTKYVVWWGQLVWSGVKFHLNHAGSSLTDCVSACGCKHALLFIFLTQWNTNRNISKITSWTQNVNFKRNNMTVYKTVLHEASSNYACSHSFSTFGGLRQGTMWLCT